MFNTSNPLFAFLVEIVQRLGQKSPKLFVIIQWISGVLTAITGIPAVIDWICQAGDWTLPAIFITFENKTVAICSLLITFVAALPVKPAIVARDQTGQPLKAINEQKLPFTAMSERRDAAKENHPTVAIRK